MHLSEVLNCIAGAGGYHMHLVLGLLCNLHASRPIGTCFHALQSGMLPPTGVPGKFFDTSKAHFVLEWVHNL